MDCTPGSLSLTQWGTLTRIQREEGERGGVFIFLSPFWSLPQVGCLFPRMIAQVRQSSLSEHRTTPSAYPFRACAGLGVLP